MPVDLLVLGQEPVADLRGGDVPGRLGVVEERGRAAPAVRVGVLVVAGPQQLAARAQVLDEVRVGVLDEAPGVRADPLVVGAVELDRVDHLQPGLLAQAEVVLAEGHRGVHQAGAVLGGDERGGQHGVALLAPVRAGDEVERRLVGQADQLGAGKALDHLDLLAEHAAGERGGDHLRRLLARHLRAHVLELRVDGHGGVGDQRPRRRGPDDQLVAGLHAPLAGRHAEAHVDRGVDYVLVTLRNLVRGERGAASRAVRDDLVALVEQPLVPDLAQRPPDRLDVAVVERAVGVVEVDPEADPLGEPVPLLQEGEDRLAALGVELGDPVLLDLLLGGDAELLLDGDLDRQPVAVPAALALDVVAAHRLEARVDVLEDAGQDVVGAGPAVGGRRTLVEDPRLRPLTAAQRLGEDVPLAPALEDGLLHLGQRGGRVHRLGKRGHRGHSGNPRGAGRAGAAGALRRRACGRSARANASRRRRAPRRPRGPARCGAGSAGRRARGRRV